MKKTERGKPPKLLPEQIVESGSVWVDQNKEAYEELKKLVLRLSKERGVLRMRSLMEQMRDNGHAMRNAIQPYLARRLMQDVPGVVITSAPSKIDGATDLSRNLDLQEPRNL